MATTPEIWTMSIRLYQIFKTMDIRILLKISVVLWQLSSYVRAASVADFGWERSRRIQGVVAVNALCTSFCKLLCRIEHYILVYIYRWFDYQIVLRHIYTGCPRRKGPNFGRVFLRSNYTDITQKTYIQSSMVTEILAREVWNFDRYYSLIDYQIRIETGRNMWFL